jgi:hypothetical protein
MQSYRCSRQLVAEVPIRPGELVMITTINTVADYLNLCGSMRSEPLLLLVYALRAGPLSKTEK